MTNELRKTYETIKNVIGLTDKDIDCIVTENGLEVKFTVLGVKFFAWYLFKIDDDELEITDLISGNITYEDFDVDVLFKCSHFIIDWVLNTSLDM